MAMFADFMAMIVAAYVLLRCVDIASRWLNNLAKDTHAEAAASVITSIVTLVIAAATFLWTAYWFWGMFKVVGEVAKSLKNLN